MINRNRATRAGRLILAFAVATLTSMLQTVTVEAKIPGTTFCYGGVCHRTYTLEETRKLVGRTETAVTSFYDDCRFDRYNTCGLTASGAVFRADLPDNAASPFYPEGTKLLVFNPATRMAVVVRVNNAGPYKHGRTLDVSRATAERLGFKQRGVARLEVTVIAAPTPAEARYKKHRVYDPVPGPIGPHASIKHAILELAQPRYQLPEAVVLAAALGEPAPVGIAGLVLAALPDVRSQKLADARSRVADAGSAKPVRFKLATKRTAQQQSRPVRPIAGAVVLATIEKTRVRLPAVLEPFAAAGRKLAMVTVEKAPVQEVVQAEVPSAVGQGFDVSELLTAVCDDRTVVVRPGKTHLLWTTVAMSRSQSKEGCRGQAYSRTARARAKPASFPGSASLSDADDPASAAGYRQ